MSRDTILRIAGVYDQEYRGGCGRGEIDLELAQVLAWALRQKSPPSDAKVAAYIRKAFA